LLSHVIAYRRVHVTRLAHDQLSRFAMRSAITTTTRPRLKKSPLLCRSTHGGRVSASGREARWIETVRHCGSYSENGAGTALRLQGASTALAVSHSLGSP